MDQLDARSEGRVGARRRRHRQRAVEVVERRQDLAEQRLLGLTPPVLALPVGPPTEVLELGEGAEIAILGLGRFTRAGIALRAERLEALVRRARRVRLRFTRAPRGVVRPSPPIVRHGLSAG